MFSLNTATTVSGSVKGACGYLREHHTKPDTFFAAANVANIMRGADPVATGIAVANLAYVFAFHAATTAYNGMSDESQVKKTLKHFGAWVDDKETGNVPTKLVKAMFRFAGRELSNPLRMVAYATLAAGVLLLLAYSGGSAAALFPGLAASCFCIGNFFQSSPKLQAWRQDPNSNKFLKAITHSAVWYGLGYAATGIGIGGGMALLKEPSKNIIAAIMTYTGLVISSASLAGMATGKIKNEAAPIAGVAASTLFFAVTGICLHDMVGAAVGFLACAGETSLGFILQKAHNLRTGNHTAQEPESRTISEWVENLLTMPYRFIMRRRLVESVTRPDLAPA